MRKILAMSVLVAVACVLLGGWQQQGILAPITGASGSVVASGPSLSGTFVLFGGDGTGASGSCATPCAVSVTVGSGKSVVLIWMSNFISTGSCTDNGSGGANTYTFTSSGSYAVCYSLNVAHSATTVTVSTGGGGNVGGVAQVITGATALDGAVNQTAPGTTSFTSGTITPTANGLAVCGAISISVDVRPVTFNSPWATNTTWLNNGGWTGGFSTRTTSSGTGFTCNGTTTTNAASDLALIHVK